MTDHPETCMRPGNQTSPTVSICIPHYQVKQLMTACLRAIRRYTPQGPAFEVIVVDNGSRDDSLDWLRSLGWIHLVERGERTPDDWIRAMATALDIGLERARGKYYLIMHSDTIVKREGWLQRLVDEISRGPDIGSAGTGKLETRGPVDLFFRRATDTKRLRLWVRRTFLGDIGARQLPREPCARDFCALYRTDVLRENHLSFVQKGGYSAGETIHYDLKKLGYRPGIIPVREVMQYIDHIAHATGAILPERKLNRAHMFRKTRRRLSNLLDREDIRSLLADPSLDG